MIVLDTHVLFWAASEPRRLSRAAARAIEGETTSGGGVWISTVSLYELADMLRKKRLRGGVSVQGDIEAITAAVRVGSLEITAEIAALATEFPMDFSRDPMDRLIAATARAHEVPLVTKDERMLDSPLLRTIW